MKLWLISALLFTIGVLAGAQSNSSGGIHVDPAKVAAAVADLETLEKGARPGAWTSAT